MDEKKVRERKLRARKARIRKKRIRFLGYVSVFILSIVSVCYLCKTVLDDRQIVSQAQASDIPKSEIAEVHIQEKDLVEEAVYKIAEAEQVNVENTVKTLDYKELLASIQSSSIYPESLVELAERNEEAIEYVYKYPVDKDKIWDGDLEDEVSASEIPLFIQWDSRWGYDEYGDGLMGYTGCGPTCLSMVAVHYLEDTSYTPLAVAEFADQNGYYCEGSGSYWALMTEGARELGLQAEEFGISEKQMQGVLQEGKSIIAAMGPGDFTEGGHFIVITGYEADGFTVNDPNSYDRSSKLWDYDTLIGQIKGMWSVW